MRILVTGASGMLGSSLSLELSKKHKVFATGNSLISFPLDYKIFDLSNESYKELIDWSKPELIIHCAALTDGNYCQNNFSKAFNINSFSVKKIIDATEDFVKIIYISSDAVFSSSLNMAREIDCTSPESIYGKSKELGEFFLLNSNREYLILRTTIVGLNIFSNIKKGFVQWILDSIKVNQTISLFDDVFFTPISIWDFISEVSFLIDQNSNKSNIFNLAGVESTTKYDFGMALIEELNLDTKYIKRGRISDFSGRVNRSCDQTLDCSLYQSTFKRKLPKNRKTILSIKNNLEL
jgi:dTDP-4-dehydrorhamnose reductase